MTSDYHVLHGEAFSVVLEADGAGAPLWRYFGPRLPDGVLPGAVQSLFSCAPLLGAAQQASAREQHVTGEQPPTAHGACRVRLAAGRPCSEACHRGSRPTRAAPARAGGTS